MSPRDALWNLCLLVHEQTTKAQDDPVLAVAVESCRVLSVHIKEPLPDQATLTRIRNDNDELRGGPPRPVASKPQPRVLSGNVREALDHCDYILDNVDDIPEKGEEFAESIRSKALSMKDTITKNGTVNQNQLTALENMRSGLDRWLR